MKRTLSTEATITVNGINIKINIKNNNTRKVTHDFVYSKLRIQSIKTCQNGRKKKIEQF